MKDRINVRCCCQPQKILGTLPAPSALQVKNRLPLMAVLRSGSMWDFNPYVSDQAVAVERVCLPLEVFTDKDGSCELAYKSEETPIEKLKRIPGFEPT